MHDNLYGHLKYREIRNLRKHLTIDDYKWKASPESNNEKTEKETIKISILMQSFLTVKTGSHTTAFIFFTSGTYVAQFPY